MSKATGLVADIWGVSGAIALALLMVAATLVSSLVIVLVNEASPAIRQLHPNVTTAAIGLGLVLAYAVVIVVAWAGSRAGDVSLADGVGLRRTSLAATLGLGLGVAVGARLLAGVYGLVLQQAGLEIDTPPVDPTQLMPRGPLGIAFTVLVVVVLAPVAEEIVFRGVLMPVFADRWGRFWGIGVSSAVFAGMHLVPYTMLPIFVLAILLSWLFIRTRSLWPAIVAHALFNGIGLVAAYVLSTGASR